MKRWLKRVPLALLVALVVTYVGDWAIYKLRGSPSSTVTVNRYQTVPLKGNKIEYDYLGTADVACSVSLFPQAGESPCWHLRRNPNQTISL
ncbi:MAG: hypothetical protein ABSF53_22440 [Terracidiphilus sp.]|jgi:hypothetical protein